MASGSIKYVAIPDIREIQGSLKTSVTITGNSSAGVFDHADLRKAFTGGLAVGSFPPDHKQLQGVIYLWASGGSCVQVDCIVWGDNTLSLTLRNLSGSAATISAIRLLTFWL